MPNINLRPVGDYQGLGRVYRVKSLTNHVGWHFVVLLGDEVEDEEAICSCTGYQVHEKCWHVEKVYEWEEARLNSEHLSSDSDSED